MSNAHFRCTFNFQFSPVRENCRLSPWTGMKLTLNSRTLVDIVFLLETESRPAMDRKKARHDVELSINEEVYKRRWIFCCRVSGYVMTMWRATLNYDIKLPSFECCKWLLFLFISSSSLLFHVKLSTQNIFSDATHRAASSCMCVRRWSFVRRPRAMTSIVEWANASDFLALPKDEWLRFLILLRFQRASTCKVCSKQINPCHNLTWLRQSASSSRTSCRIMK